jgi:hypothetical protein
MGPPIIMAGQGGGFGRGRDRLGLVGKSPPPIRSVANAASGDPATGRGRRRGGV